MTSIHVPTCKHAGFGSLEELTDAAVPKHIRLAETVPLEPAKSESEALAELKAIASKNKVLKSLIGMVSAGRGACVCTCTDIPHGARSIADGHAHGTPPRSTQSDQIN